MGIRGFPMNISKLIFWSFLFKVIHITFKKFPDQPLGLKPVLGAGNHTPSRRSKSAIQNSDSSDQVSKRQSYKGNLVLKNA